MNPVIETGAVGGATWACGQCLAQLGADPETAAVLAVLLGVWAPRLASWALAWWQARRTTPPDFRQQPPASS